jgi:hypothetical protein
VSWSDAILIGGLAILLATLDAGDYDELWRGFLNGLRLLTRCKR